MKEELSSIKYRKIGQRYVEWFSDYELSYDGVTHKSNRKWPPLLFAIAKLFNNYTGIAFNSALVNYHADGNSFIPLHCDNSKRLDNTFIASLSIGDTRCFHLLHERTNINVFQLPLQSGSLALMIGNFQQHFKHSIPVSKSTKPRYNITFRLSINPNVV